MSAPPLEAAWRRLAERGPAGPAGRLALAALTPLSWGYRLASAVKRAFFWRLPGTQTTVGVPVIAVGNLTVGGTGKTPLTACVAELLAARGRRVAVLTRGYRARHRRPVTRAGTGGALLVPGDEVGDEGRWLIRRLPDATIWVAKRRALAARAAAAAGAQAVVLDDALQYWRLARDLDVVAVDGEVPFGNGRRFPAGLLREPPAALARAGAVVVKADADGRAPALAAVVAAAAGAPVYTARYRPRTWLDRAGREVALGPGAARIRSAACGVARPEPFFRSVEALAGRPVSRRVFGDHHRFRPGDLAGLPGAVALTEKDRENLPAEPAPGDPELLFLACDLALTPVGDAPPLDAVLGRVLGGDA